MGCTGSKLQGDAFDSIDANATRSSYTNTKSSYSLQPGRQSRAPTSTSETATSERELPTDEDAGIVPIAAAPAGNWSADRERIRQDHSAYFSFKKQPAVQSTNGNATKQKYARFL